MYIPPLVLGEGSVNSISHFFDRQRLVLHVSAAKDAHTTQEEFWTRLLQCGPCLMKGKQAMSPYSTSRFRVISTVTIGLVPKLIRRRTEIGLQRKQGYCQSVRLWSSTEHRDIETRSNDENTGERDIETSICQKLEIHNQYLF